MAIKGLDMPRAVGRFRQSPVQGTPAMRAYAAFLACLIVASTAHAQVDQNGAHSSIQNVPSKSSSENGENASRFVSKWGETQEQHDHYIHRNPENQPINSDTTSQGDDD